MYQNILRILVVDNEYLIALDAERILRDAISCDVTIIARADCAAKVRAEYFDVVLLDIDGKIDTLAGDVQAVVAAGSHLVFSTTNDEFVTKVPGFPDTHVLLKPYQDETLSAAISRFIQPA